MADIQRNRSHIPPLRHATEYGTREGHPTEVNEVSPVKRLDGKVVREGASPFAGGTDYDVCAGRWKRCNGEEGGKGICNVKVGVIPATSTLLA